MSNVWLLRAVLGLLIATAMTGVASAKARLIVVAPIKSTLELQPQAAATTSHLIAKLAELDGYDARPMTQAVHRDAEDAAAMGAEIYLSGQLLRSNDQSVKLSVSAFDVATDHRLGSFEGLLIGGRLGSDFSARVLIGQRPNGTSSPPLLTGANAPSRATNLLLVPFQLPDNKDVALEFATTEFVKKMQAKGITIVESPVIDHVEAATKATAFCTQYNVKGVIVGTARHEQRLNFMLGSYPTHAEARVSLIDCSGQTVWKGFGTGDIVYYWSNAGAAVSDAMGKALDTIVTQFFERGGPPDPKAL